MVITTLRPKVTAALPNNTTSDADTAARAVAGIAPMALTKKQRALKSLRINFLRKFKIHNLRFFAEL